jgi:hypothetical protein
MWLEKPICFSPGADRRLSVDERLLQLDGIVFKLVPMTPILKMEVR